MSAAVNRYGSIAAEIYDLDKPVGSRRDAPFYVKRLRGMRGAVLEPACGGGLLESQLEIMANRYWSFEEAKLTLASAGFEIEAIHGDYTAARPLRARDRVWTFEVRRAG